MYKYFHKIHPILVCGGYYWTAFQVFQGGDVGGPYVPHHIQCGSGRSGSTLGTGDSRAIGRSGRAQTGGMTPKRHLIRRWWHGSVIIPGMDAEVFKNPVRDVRLGVPEDNCQEDSRNGLLTLSGSRHPVGGGVQETDGGGRTIKPGEAAS